MGEPEAALPQPSQGAEPAPEEAGPRAGGIQKAIEEMAPDVLAALPSDKREKLLSVIGAVSVIMHHAGPLPRPEDIARYNQHIPEGADRIMRMAESQLSHRIEMERTIVVSQQKLSSRGQVFGLIIALFGMSAGAAVALLGHDWVGAAIAGTTVISLVYAFVTGKKYQQRGSPASRGQQ